MTRPLRVDGDEMVTIAEVDALRWWPDAEIIRRWGAPDLGVVVFVTRNQATPDLGVLTTERVQIATPESKTGTTVRSWWVK